VQIGEIPTKHYITGEAMIRLLAPYPKILSTSKHGTQWIRQESIHIFRKDLEELLP
jgi:hypothetical protein